MANTTRLAVNRTFSQYAAWRGLQRHGVGPDSAAALLIAAGDNPDRMHSEASFAALCAGAASTAAATAAPTPLSTALR